MGTRGLIVFAYKRFYFMIYNQFDSYPSALGMHLAKQLMKAEQYNRYSLYHWRMFWSYILWKTYTEKSRKLDSEIWDLSSISPKPFPYFVGCIHYPTSFLWNIEEQLAVMPTIIHHKFENTENNNDDSKSYPTTLSPEMLEIPWTDTIHYPIMVDHKEYMRQINHQYMIKTYDDLDDIKQELDKEIKYVYCIDLWRDYFHCFGHNIHICANLHDSELDDEYMQKLESIQ